MFIAQIGPRNCGIDILVWRLQFKASELNSADGAGRVTTSFGVTCGVRDWPVSSSQFGAFRRGSPIASRPTGAILSSVVIEEIQSLAGEA